MICIELANTLWCVNLIWTLLMSPKCYFQSCCCFTHAWIVTFFLHLNKYSPNQLLSFLSWSLRKLRARDVSKFHIQLCLSLGAMFIVFVAGFDRTEYRAGCITVGVLIHYFTLVAWMWMGAEALLMFQKLVIVFGHVTYRSILLASLFCWSKCSNTNTHTPTHETCHLIIVKQEERN